MAENKFLDKINSPADVKKLSVPQLEQLAKEIRQLLISVISHTGGHLAPNLGVVELTLALHKVFNTPEDKIIFDVGHQAYIHKIITGRREQFPTLRQYGGLSGFPKRSESEHDAFGTGHSSTSISAALGMACARDLQGEDYNVVAVIGDGSMTGGMAFEALNNAGMLHKKMIVVLNDNEMSISKNVGAMSEYLYQLRTGETYNKIKNDIEGWLKNMEFGSDVLKTTIHIPEGQIAGVHVGNEASITLPAYPGKKLIGKITRIAPVADLPAHTFAAEVSVDNSEGLLAGVYANVTLTASPKADVLTIPVQAIVMRDDQQTVFVVDDKGVVQRRVLNVGYTNDKLAEIVSGLDEKDTIVIEGHNKLREGSKIDLKKAGK